MELESIDLFSHFWSAHSFYLLSMGRSVKSFLVSFDKDLCWEVLVGIDRIWEMLVENRSYLKDLLWRVSLEIKTAVWQYAGAFNFHTPLCFLLPLILSNYVVSFTVFTLCQLPIAEAAIFNCRYFFDRKVSQLVRRRIWITRISS